MDDWIKLLAGFYNVTIEDEETPGNESAGGGDTQMAVQSEQDDIGRCDPKANVAMAIFMILIVIVGLFGNAIVFFVILVLKEYRKSVSNWYVLQLAIADTLFLLMLPFIASSEMVGKWEFADSLCKAKEGILYVNYYASIFFLTIMSFDRYIAVTKSGVTPWADALRNLRSAGIISIITWIVSICLCAPLYIYSKVDHCSQCAYEFPQTASEKCAGQGGGNPDCNNSAITNFNWEGFPDVNDNMDHSRLEDFARNLGGYCHDEGKVYYIWLYLNFSVMLVLPFALICIFYGMILYTMMGTTANVGSNQRQYRRRVTLMVLALVSLFAVSWIPWYAEKLARIRGFSLSSDSACSALSNFTRIMAYLNSALNPYFYSFMGSRFHQRFIRARSTATRKSRFFSVISRMSWHGQTDSNNSTGSGGNARNNQPQNGVNLRRMNSKYEDESFASKSVVRTERTMMDTNCNQNEATTRPSETSP